MAGLDLSPEDMDFLNKALGNKPPMPEPEAPLTREEVMGWLLGGMKYADEYDEVYARIGRKMLVGLLSGASLSDQPGAVELLVAVLKNRDFGKIIMDVAVGFGSLMFAEGYEMGKENASADSQTDS